MRNTSTDTPVSDPGRTPSSTPGPGQADQVKIGLLHEASATAPLGRGRGASV